MSEQIEDRRLVFFIDNIVRQPFSTPIDPENKPMVLTSHENVVKKGEVIATAILASDVSKYSGSYDIQPFIQLGEGDNVQFDAHKQEYVALCYGFAKVTDTRKIAVQPLIFTSKNKLAGYMFIYETKGYDMPELADIKETLEMAGVVYPLEDDKIKAQLDKIEENKALLGTRIAVAKGTKPKNGQIEHVVLIKQKEEKVGTLRSDGSMDFKERHFVTKVESGEHICEFKPYIPAENGYTIYGEPIPGKMLGEKKYKIGHGLVTQKDNPNIYVAEYEGALEIDTSGKISVENKIEIRSDVDLNTGNLNVNGSIEIKGTIKPGFEVKATGNIIVNQSIEDAYVEAGGDIIVAHGILGKDKGTCRVVAKGNIQTKFIQHANIKAGGRINVKESIVQSEVFSKETVHVDANVIGGTIIGKNGLDVGVAGSTSFQKTVLIAGKDPEIEEKVNILNKKIKDLSLQYKEHIEDMKMQFGENFLRDLGNFVKGLIGARKVKFVEMLKQLKEFNSTINKVTAEREELKEKIYFPKPPTIVIHGKVYPEVFIQIRNSKKKIEKVNDATTFREDPELKCII